MENRSKVVTLCGSTKFKEEFQNVAKNLTMEGVIVLTPHIFSHADNIELSEENITMLDRLHMEMIDMSDIVVVINKDFYIGESTKKEIEYAKSKGKEIKYLLSPTTLTTI